MFSYYGTKKKLAPMYPKPEYGKIIEPFAGAAQYSLLHFENDVLLVDKYDVIINVWEYLKKCSQKDILSLPRFKHGDRILKEECDCEDQYELIRFLVQEGTVGGNKAYQRALNSYETKLKTIANSLYKIRHWEFKCTDYNEIPNQKATWFIDPPYMYGGHRYKHSNKKIDFDKLAGYCMSREGQVIVCENTKANWLEFTALKSIKGINNDRTTEAIWTNTEVNNKNGQIILL